MYYISETAPIGSYVCIREDGGELIWWQIRDKQGESFLIKYQDFTRVIPIGSEIVSWRKHKI